MEQPPPDARGGARRAPRDRSGRSRTAGLGAAVVACVVAWALLVWAGIRFGHSGRAGQDAAWVFMVVAAAGAVACLFAALMLGVRLAREAGARAPRRPAGERGGRRAAGRRARGR